MQDSYTLSEDAARLIGFGLQPRVRPAMDANYAELLQRFRADGRFQATVSAVARGFRLRVLDASDHGLVLGCDQDSPFALRLRDYRAMRSAEERMLHGLVQLAVATWCFPTAESLDDPDDIVKRVRTVDIVSFLVRLSEHLDEHSERDADAAHPELQEAWRGVLARAETRGTPDGRRAASSLTGVVEHALETLAGGGLLRRIDGTAGGEWITQPSYRIQVRELAAVPVYHLVRDAASNLTGVR